MKLVMDEKAFEDWCSLKRAGSVARIDRNSRTGVSIAAMVRAAIQSGQPTDIQFEYSDEEIAVDNAMYFSWRSDLDAPLQTFVVKGMKLDLRCVVIKYFCINSCTLVLRDSVVGELQIADGCEVTIINTWVGKLTLGEAQYAGLAALRLRAKVHLAVMLYFRMYCSRHPAGGGCSLARSRTAL